MSAKTLNRRKNYTLTRRTVGNREVVSINVDASNRRFLVALHQSLHSGKAHPSEHDSLVALAFDLGEMLDLPFQIVVQP